MVVENAKWLYPVRLKFLIDKRKAYNLPAYFISHHPILTLLGGGIMNDRGDDFDLRTSNKNQTVPEDLIETSDFDGSEAYKRDINNQKSLKQAILEGSIPGAYNNKYVRGKQE